MKQRKAVITRTTSETDVKLALNLDGTGKGNAATGIPFLDHMLMLFAKHGLFDLDVACKGDLEIDAHHSVEDVGICLGLALEKAVGDKKGIVRFAHSYFPMDETLVRVAVDLSGRPYFVRSEEHTSELQSHSDLVCRLLLEKKKITITRV